MSGFFVSNSFGTFNSEVNTKKFNTEFIGWGGSSTTGKFKDMLKGTDAAAPNLRPSHFSKKKGDASHYMGVPSYMDWDGDKMELSGGGDYGFQIKGANDASAWYEIEVPSGCALGGTGHIGPSADAHGWSGSILTAANSSQFPSIQKVGTAKNKVRVELTKGTHYISLDPGADVSGIGTFTVYLADKDGNDFKFERDNSKKMSVKTLCSATGGTWGTPVKLSMIKWTKWIDGCGKPHTDATNYDSSVTRNDNSCTYVAAPITTFTISKSSVTGGANDSVTFNWTLDSSGRKSISLVTLYANNSDGRKKIQEWGPKVFSQRVDYNTSSLPVGTTTFELVAVWDKNSGNPSNKSVSLTVNSPQTLINCDDPNASKYGQSSTSGDCGACNTGYYLGTDGLCTNCASLPDADPYRNMDTTTGQCKTGENACVDGFALKDGICVPSGCADPDDYNYNPDLYDTDDNLIGVNDPSACQGDGNGGNGGTADVDCELSDWSDWSEWSDAATSSGTRTRTRTVVTAQSGGGAGCPDLEQIETGVLDPNTGTVTTTTTGGDDPAATTPASPSLAAPLIIGGIVLTIGYLVMRR